jgi:hypothetical protein
MNHRRSNNQSEGNDVFNNYNSLHGTFLSYDDQCNREFIRNNNTDRMARLEQLNVYIDNITNYITTTIKSQIFQTLLDNMKPDLLDLYKHGKFRRHVTAVQNFGPSFFRQKNAEKYLALSIISKYRSLNRLLDNPTTTSINHLTGFGQRSPSSYYY